MNENDDVKCIWAGTGDMLEEIQEKINDSIFKDRVIMTGVRNDIDFLLQGFDSFLFPSLWEGLPVSLIEAQASGLPCIVSNTITKEAEVTDKVRWLGLDESDDYWSEICISEAKRNKDNRESDINSLKKSGYDIYETAKWLTEFYCSPK